MALLDREAVVTIKTLAKQGVSNRKAARILGVSEGSVRYHLKRLKEGAVDGRSKQQPLAASYQEAINAYLEAVNQESPENITDLHDWLVAEHDYPGSLRNLQRYVQRAFPGPVVRARRRVETPPGAQSQVDWAYFPKVWLSGQQVDLLAFCMQLSNSRADATIWSLYKHQLAWLACHNDAFRRLAGIPATVRVDNEKTAVSRGAGAWGIINSTYRRYAETVRFHIDACQPRSPQAKGKIERRIRDKRLGFNPYGRHWNDLEELQEWTDERNLLSWEKRTCPITGTSVREAYEAELPYLTPVGVLPEPFDVAITRRVDPDCTVNFEGRAYSVPFSHVGRPVEIRGCNGKVQILGGSVIVAEHPRGTQERIILTPEHYEGEATSKVLPPQPLGRMGRRLQEISAMMPEQRPLDLYAALAEVAR
jgi:transposase